MEAGEQVARRRFVGGIAMVMAVVVVVGSVVVAPPVSAGSCSSGGGDSEPEGRPYRSGSETQDPGARKHAALTTINADGIRSGCECVDSRPWEQGLPADAVASVRAAMDLKEAIAIHNYGRFGVPAEQVPVGARTIWIRTAWRSYDEQVCLRGLFGSGAALPGRSKHEIGVAIDIEDWGPQNAGVDAGALRAHGWCPTVSSEPWHYEYRPQLEAIGQGYRCIK